MAKANKLIPVVDGTAGTPIELIDSRIEITNPAANDLLQYDSTQQQFVNTPTSSVVPSLRTVNHEQITDSSLGDANLHDGFYFPNAVQDYDGNWYGAVVIGDQVWLAENLRTTHLTDGTAITNSTPNTTSPYYRENTSVNLPIEKKGLIYNGYVLSGIAPQNWKVPNNSDMQILIRYLGKQKRYYLGGDSTFITKSIASTEGWSSSNEQYAIGNDQTLNNSCGLNLFPGGGGHANTNYTDYILMWTATNYSASSDRIIYGATNNAYTLATTGYPIANYFCTIRLLSNLTPVQFRDWYVKTYGSLQHNIFNVQVGQDLKIIPNKLPYGYEELEYLESSGTQYINTGVSLGVNSTVFISATVQGKGDVGMVYSFDQDYNGSYMQDNGSIFRASGLGTNSSNSLVKTNVSSRWISTSSEFTSVHTIGEETSSEYTSTRVDGLNNYITLFTAAAWNAANSRWSGRIYRCSISKNNTLVRNLIPAKRTSDNVLGLYDTVSGTLFTNAGSGTFIAGPVVAIGGKDTIAFTNESGYAILPSMSGNSSKVLAVNSSETDVEWVTQSGGGEGGASQLNDLSDVTVSSPSSGQVLLYNGTNWNNGELILVLTPTSVSGGYKLSKSPTELINYTDAGVCVILNVSGSFFYRNARSAPDFYAFSGSNTIKRFFYYANDENGVDTIWRIANTNLQSQLVSGTNIRTINNISLLAAGNLTIPAPTINTRYNPYSISADGSTSFGLNGNREYSRMQFADGVTTYGFTFTVSDENKNYDRFVLLDNTNNTKDVTITINTLQIATNNVYSDCDNIFKPRPLVVKAGSFVELTVKILKSDVGATTGIVTLNNNISRYVTIYSGSTAPSSSTGSDGDIYIQTVS